MQCLNKKVCVILPVKHCVTSNHLHFLGLPLPVRAFAFTPGELQQSITTILNCYFIFVKGSCCWVVLFFFWRVFFEVWGGFFFGFCWGIFFCYFSSSKAINSKTRVSVRIADLLVTVYTEAEFSALGFYSVIFIPCPFPSTAVVTDTGITSVSYTQLSKTSIPVTALQRHHLQSCCFAADVYKSYPHQQLYLLFILL